MVALVIAVLSALAATGATAIALWHGVMLRKQLEHGDRVRRASFHQAITHLFIQIDTIFLENPSLRPYFYGNVAASDDVVKHQVLALAEYLADVAESCTAAEDVLPELTGDWDDYFNYLYRNSPALRQYWASFGHLYPPRVVRAFLGPSARPKQWPAMSSVSDKL